MKSDCQNPNVCNIMISLSWVALLVKNPQTISRLPFEMRTGFKVFFSQLLHFCLPAAQTLILVQHLSCTCVTLVCDTVNNWCTLICKVLNFGLLHVYFAFVPCSVQWGYLNNHAYYPYHYSNHV